MSDIPLPGPLTDEEIDDLDYLWENYDPDADAWESALDWARKGDFIPLAECLRFNPSAPRDQMAVRNFLADVLDETFKKPRNSKAKRDQEFVPFVDIDGRQLSINKRYLPQAEAIKRVREVMRKKKCSQADAIEAVVKELGTKDEFKLAKYRDKLTGWVHDQRPWWGLNQRTVQEMFGDVVKLKD